MLEQSEISLIELYIQFNIFFHTKEGFQQKIIPVYMEMLLATQNNYTEDGRMMFEKPAETRIKFQPFAPIRSTPFAHSLPNKRILWSVIHSNDSYDATEVS